MRLPAFLTVVTPAGRSLLLLGGVSYLLDALGGWPVFQLLWVASVGMALAAVVIVLLPLRSWVELDGLPAAHGGRGRCRGGALGDHVRSGPGRRTAGRVPLVVPVGVPVGVGGTCSGCRPCAGAVPWRSGSR